MKKIYIIVVLVVLLFISLPFIGNKLAKDAINDQLTTLTSNGVTLQESSEESGFFSSSNHYQFLVSDSQKFTLYLSQFADKQLPPYVNAMAQGLEVGCDVTYSNLPFSNALEVDIYPLSLPYNMKKELKKYDFRLFNTIDTFLQSKGLLYHLNYNLLTSSFDGYIKDIEQTLNLKDDVKILMKLESLLFDGGGPLIAPTELRVSGDTMSFKLFDDKSEIYFLVNDIESSSTFSSATSYISSASLKTLNIAFKEKNMPVTSIDIDDLKFNVSSSMEGAKAEVYAKSSFEKLNAKFKQLELAIDAFNYDISVTDVDKDAIEELRVLLSQTKTNTSSQLQREIESSATRLLAQGLKINIADFSVDTLSIEQSEGMRGFALQSEIILSPNPSLKSTAQTAQMLGHLFVESSFTLSKELFVYISQQAPLSTMAMAYAKDVGDDLVFDIVLKDGKLLINDKAL
jgi:hypothetical protein